MKSDSRKLDLVNVILFSIIVEDTEFEFLFRELAFWYLFDTKYFLHH